jgi:hypothetical protein
MMPTRVGPVLARVVLDDRRVRLLAEPLVPRRPDGQDDEPRRSSPQVRSRVLSAWPAGDRRHRGHRYLSLRMTMPLPRSRSPGAWRGMRQARARASVHSATARGGRFVAIRGGLGQIVKRQPSPGRCAVSRRMRSPVLNGGRFRSSLRRRLGRGGASCCVSARPPPLHAEDPALAVNLEPCLRVVRDRASGLPARRDGRAAVELRLLRTAQRLRLACSYVSGAEAAPGIRSWSGRFSAARRVRHSRRRRRRDPPRARGAAGSRLAARLSARSIGMPGDAQYEDRQLR